MRRSRDRIKSNNKEFLQNPFNSAIIQQLFLKAGQNSRLKPMSMEDCEWTSHLMNQGPKLLGADHFETRWEVKNLGVARKYGNLFLKHIVKPQYAIQLYYERAKSLRMDDKENPFFIRRNQIERTVEELSLLLDMFENKNTRSYDWMDLAQDFASWAQAGWWRGKQHPKGTKEHDPLCIFVHGALEFIGIHKKPVTVSEVLRGRRGRSARRGRVRGGQN